MHSASDRSNSHPISHNPKHCPPIAPHSNEQSPDSQDCIYVPQRGADGCIQSYNLVCPQKPSKHAIEASTKSPLVNDRCPRIKPPVNKTAAGCMYAENFDKKGCVSSYDMICSTPLAELTPSKPTSHLKPLQMSNQHSGPMDWRWMLGGESYKGAALKDPRKFRPKASPAVPSSGRFVACKRQSDCFYYREPKEWCSGHGRNSTLYAWT